MYGCCVFVFMLIHSNLYVTVRELFILHEGEHEMKFDNKYIQLMPTYVEGIFVGKIKILGC